MKGRSIRIALLFIAAISGAPAFAQQIVMRGEFGKPSQVMDETQQWTTPLMVASDPEVAIYIPDITNPDWLKSNYDSFHNHGTYVLSMFTFYRTPKACRQNQIGWGLGDKAHFDACVEIGYRVRQAKIDPQQKSATLIMAAMISQYGEIDSSTIQSQSTFRTWDQLDENTRKGLERANAFVVEQMRIYDRKVQSLR